MSRAQTRAGNESVDEAYRTVPVRIKISNISKTSSNKSL
jgi:hypothetical protein